MLDEYLSLGSGVQSSCIALMATAGLITPMPKGAIFADTQCEPAEVYTWLAWLEPQLAFPVHRVTAGDLAERELTLRKSKKSGKIYRKTAIPAFGKNPDGSMGILGRKCTTDHKIIPIIKKLRTLTGVKRGAKKLACVQWLGISSDERQRMKMPRDAWIRHRWPLIELDMTRGHCLEWMDAQGFPRPPRSACSFCPFHSNAEWRNLRDNHPRDWDFVVQFEKDMQQAALHDQALTAVPYLHKDGVNIELVDLTDPSEMQGQFSFLDECDGLCGV